MPSLTLTDMASRTMADKPKKNWIKKAIPKEHHGRFREKAERARKSTRAFAKEHEHDSGTLGKEARLAETLMGMKHKKSPLYDHPRSHKD